MHSQAPVNRLHHKTWVDFWVVNRATGGLLDLPKIGQRGLVKGNPSNQTLQPKTVQYKPAHPFDKVRTCVSTWD